MLFEYVHDLHWIDYLRVEDLFKRKKYIEEVVKVYLNPKYYYLFAHRHFDIYEKLSKDIETKFLTHYYVEDEDD
jgi:hypothetical protein